MTTSTWWRGLVTVAPVGDARHDARHGLAARVRGRREADERAVLELEAGDRDEVLVAADARVLASADAVGDDLPVEVDRDARR